VPEHHHAAGRQATRPQPRAVTYTSRPAALWFERCPFPLRDRESNRERILVPTPRVALVPHSSRERPGDVMKLRERLKTSNPQVRNQIRPSPQVSASGPENTLKVETRVRTRWDYRREAPGHGGKSPPLLATRSGRCSRGSSTRTTAPKWPRSRPCCARTCVRLCRRSRSGSTGGRPSPVLPPHWRSQTTASATSSERYPERGRELDRLVDLTRLPPQRPFADSRPDGAVRAHRGPSR
jgi:hypothetical protein